MNLLLLALSASAQDLPDVNVEEIEAESKGTAEVESAIPAFCARQVSLGEPVLVSSFLDYLSKLGIFSDGPLDVPLCPAEADDEKEGAETTDAETEDASETKADG